MVALMDVLAKFGLIELPLFPWKFTADGITHLNNAIINFIVFMNDSLRGVVKTSTEWVDKVIRLFNDRILFASAERLTTALSEVGLKLGESITIMYNRCLIAVEETFRCL